MEYEGRESSERFAAKLQEGKDDVPDYSNNSGFRSNYHYLSFWDTRVIIPIL